MTLHAQRERLQSLEQQERIERADAWSHIAQGFAAGLHAEAKIAKSLIEAHAVIAGRGIDNLRKFPIVPGEFARLNQHARDRGAVPADEFCRRMYHDVRAILEWPAEIGCGERVVYHQGHARLMRDLRYRLDVEHIPARIADRLSIQHTRARRKRLAEVLRV